MKAYKAKEGWRRMGKLRMYYVREDFGSVEDARAHFDRNWTEDNPRIARNLSLEEVREKYEGLTTGTDAGIYIPRSMTKGTLTLRLQHREPVISS